MPKTKPVRYERTNPRGSGSCGCEETRQYTRGGEDIAPWVKASVGGTKSGVGDAYLHSVGLTRLAAVGGMARAEPSHRDFAPRAGCQIMDCSQGKDTQWRP